ncbi:hypothetical protein BHE74_00032943 [Ensete ventricosum]|nr:hypothetical protein BHE74_00032943 [Ensete ventricosum]
MVVMRLGIAKIYDPSNMGGDTYYSCCRRDCAVGEEDGSRDRSRVDYSGSQQRCGRRRNSGERIVVAGGSGDIGTEIVARDRYNRGWQRCSLWLKGKKGDGSINMVVIKKKQCWVKWQQLLEWTTEGNALQWEAEMAMRDRYSRGRQQQWRLWLHGLQAADEGGNSNGKGDDDGNAVAM